jgi:hypothetical protein
MTKGPFLQSIRSLRTDVQYVEGSCAIQMMKRRLFEEEKNEWRKLVAVADFCEDERRGDAELKVATCDSS